MEQTEAVQRPDLRDELLRRAGRDQQARVTGDVRLPDGEAMARVDAENLPWLRALVDEVGWPGRSLVGDDGADAAWLLVQHADQDPAFQRRCLGLLGPAVADGEASGAHLAYLTDRVLLAEGRPQLYATQVTSRNGQWVPAPLEDPETVDRRRADLGLPPLADYLAFIAGEHGEAFGLAFPCPGCGEQVRGDPPPPDEPLDATCPACGRVTQIRIDPLVVSEDIER